MICLAPYNAILTLYMKQPYILLSVWIEFTSFILQNLFLNNDNKLELLIHPHIWAQPLTKVQQYYASSVVMHMTDNFLLTSM